MAFTPISSTPTSSRQPFLKMWWPQPIMPEPITAMVGYDNLAGTQFHPEKSQALGLALIANFLRWKP